MSVTFLVLKSEQSSCLIRQLLNIPLIFCTLLVSKLSTLIVSALVPENIFAISVTLLVLKFFKSSFLKLAAANMLFIVVTFAVFNLLKSIAVAVALSIPNLKNMLLISVTLPVSNLLISKLLRFISPANKPDISVTSLVSAFSKPLISDKYLKLANFSFESGAI